MTGKPEGGEAATHARRALWASAVFYVLIAEAFYGNRQVPVF